MTRGNLQISRKFCPACSTNTKCERNATVWGCGDVFLVFFSCGLWLIPKWMFNNYSNPWRCSLCGGVAAD